MAGSWKSFRQSVKPRWSALRRPRENNLLSVVGADEASFGEDAIFAKMASVSCTFFRLGFEHRPQSVVLTVEHRADRLPTRHVFPIRPCEQQALRHFRGGDSRMCQCGLKRRVCLSRGFDQLANIPVGEYRR